MFFTAEEGTKEVVCGAHVRDTLTNEEYDIHAKCVVNATGPFTDSIRIMDKPDAAKICAASSGIHVVLPSYYRLVKVPLFDYSAMLCCTLYGLEPCFYYRIPM